MDKIVETVLKHWNTLQNSWAVLLPANTILIGILFTGIWKMLERDYKNSIRKRDDTIGFLEKRIKEIEDGHKRQVEILKQENSLAEKQLKDAKETLASRTDSTAKEVISQDDENRRNYSQLSDNELSRTALKLTRQLKQQAESLLPMDPYSRSNLEMGLHNAWIMESPKLLILKKEILSRLESRLPAEIVDRLDRFADAYYQNTITSAQYIIDATEEIQNLASKLTQP